MSAEVLRRAAASMRERAEASDWLAIPARVDIDRDGTCDGCSEANALVASYPDPDNEPWLCAECAGAADYIASWHPAVALAVAELFDVLAVYYETSTPGALVLNDGAALAVARAYLGEQA